MLRNTPLPILLAAGYLATCAILLPISATHTYGNILLYISPLVIAWTVFAIYKHSKNIVSTLDNDEFGYGK